jgi:hypothetical protein
MEVYPGAMEAHHETAETQGGDWRLTLENWRFNLEPKAFILEL